MPSITYSPETISEQIRQAKVGDNVIFNSDRYGYGTVVEVDRNDPFAGIRVKSRNDEFNTWFHAEGHISFPTSHPDKFGFRITGIIPRFDITWLKPGTPVKLRNGFLGYVKKKPSHHDDFPIYITNDGTHWYYSSDGTLNIDSSGSRNLRDVVEVLNTYPWPRIDLSNLLPGSVVKLRNGKEDEIELRSTSDGPDIHLKYSSWYYNNGVKNTSNEDLANEDDIVEVIKAVKKEERPRIDISHLQVGSVVKLRDGQIIKLHQRCSSAGGDAYFYGIGWYYNSGAMNCFSHHDSHYSDIVEVIHAVLSSAERVSIGHLGVGSIVKLRNGERLEVLRLSHGELYLSDRIYYTAAGHRNIELPDNVNQHDVVEIITAIPKESPKPRVAIGHLGVGSQVKLRNGEIHTVTELSHSSGNPYLSNARYYKPAGHINIISGNGNHEKDVVEILRVVPKPAPNGKPVAIVEVPLKDYINGFSDDDKVTIPARLLKTLL